MAWPLVEDFFFAASLSESTLQQRPDLFDLCICVPSLKDTLISDLHFIVVKIGLRAALRACALRVLVVGDI